VNRAFAVLCSVLTFLSEMFSTGHVPTAPGANFTPTVQFAPAPNEEGQLLVATNDNAGSSPHWSA